MKISKLKIIASGFFVLMLSVFFMSNVKAAEEAKPFKIGPAEISFNAGFMSAYQWRGEDQNSGDSTASFGADISLPANVYVGTWTASASTSSSQEVDVYAGIKPTLGSFGLDLGYIAYVYPGNATTANANFGEYYLGVSYAPEKAPYSFKAKYSKADSGKCAKGSAVSCDNMEYSASYDLLSITYGDYDKNRTYTTLALTKEYGGISFSAAYTDTDWESGVTKTNNKDNFFVLSATKSF